METPPPVGEPKRDPGRDPGREIDPFRAPGPPATPVFDDPRRSRAFALLFACTMVIGIGNSILFAVLPPIARASGLNDIAVGVIYSVSAFLFATMAPVWGRVSDRVGRRPILVLGFLGYAVSMTVFSGVVMVGMAGALTGFSLVASLVAARSLFGLLGSAATPAASAWVADRAAPQARTAALAALSAGFGLGGVIGPAAASVAAPHLGLVAPLTVSAGLAALAAVMVRLYLPEHTQPQEIESPSATSAPSASVADGPAVRRRGGLAAVLDPRLRAVAVIGAISWTVQGAMLQTITLLMMDRLDVAGARAAEYAGVALTAGALATLVAQLGVVGAFRPTPRAALLSGTAVSVCGALFLAVAPGLGAIAFGFAVMSFGMGLERAGVAGAASLAVGPDEQGVAAGVATATAGVGFVLAPLVGVVMRAALGPAAPYLACAGLLVMSLVLIWRAQSLRDRF